VIELFFKLEIMHIKIGIQIFWNVMLPLGK